MSGKLFSCVLDDAGPGITTSENEDEVVDKVLREGLRLKKKCKQLQQQLAETEAQRCHAHAAYEQALLDKDRQCEEYAVRINSSHRMEIQKYRDTKGKFDFFFFN